MRAWIKPDHGGVRRALHRRTGGTRSATTARVVAYMQNRRENPEPGVTADRLPGHHPILEYGGDGRFRPRGGLLAPTRARPRRRSGTRRPGGAHDPGHRARRTRPRLGRRARTGRRARPTGPGVSAPNNQA
ncbi:MAG: hypothetical protein U5R31_06155 [Acidimicrobiia bacterium]|nr:hypothetical protein [Acidimicrobiia bacterium]